MYDTPLGGVVARKLNLLLELKSNKSSSLPDYGRIHIQPLEIACGTMEERNVNLRGDGLLGPLDPGLFAVHNFGFVLQQTELRTNFGFVL